ncbi:CU044_2847 family protein, partial [Streptomyces sp. NPDC051098]|uniref:CU044_2847 family protein n=1 Tax=Streptomyces sp. NPDC051098 TaxID=3155411 RepID=UPI00341ED357
MNGRIQRIELPGGAVVLARLSTAGGGYGEDDEDVGFVENATAKVRQLRELITEVGASVLEAAAAARPDEASVSFGVELTAKSGVALAVLAAGEAKASVQVTLTWQLKDQPAPPAPVTAPAGSHVPAPAPPNSHEAATLAEVDRVRDLRLFPQLASGSTVATLLPGAEFSTRAGGT